jgi:hypothetical protein
MTTAWDNALIGSVRKKIEGEVVRVSEIILEGTIATWDDYKRLTGERRAYTTALEIIDKSEQELLSPQKPGRAA